MFIAIVISAILCWFALGALVFIAYRLEVLAKRHPVEFFNFWMALRRLLGW